jgi:hypothetical protein
LTVYSTSAIANPLIEAGESSRGGHKMFLSHCAARSGARLRARCAQVAIGGALWAGLLAAAQAATGVSIGGAPVTSVPAAKYYNFQPWALDSQHKTLRFTIVNKPAWAGFDARYGRLYGSPIPANVGTYRNIAIYVTDGQYSASLPSFSITVTPLADPGPTIGGSPSTAAVVGKSYTFQPTAHDSYGLRMVFGIVNKPAWLTINTATGQLSGTPRASDVGTYPRIVVAVSDGYKTATLPAFNLTVAGVASPGSQPPVNPPPPASTPTPTPDPAATTLSAVSLQWEPPTENTDASPLTDLRGYHVYYGRNPQSLDKKTTVPQPGVAGYVVESLTSGTWYFAVAAYNTSGVEGDRSDVIVRVVQ